MATSCVSIELMGARAKTQVDALVTIFLVVVHADEKGLQGIYFLAFDEAGKIEKYRKEELRIV